jgi:hypothetical protein
VITNGRKVTNKWGILTITVTIIGVFLTITAFNYGYYLGQLSIGSVAERALIQCVTTLGGKYEHRTN